MSDNFDLKKYLIENKATTNSRMLSENETGKFYAPTYLKQKYGEATAKEIEAEIDELDANSWDRFTAMESAEEVEDYIVDIKDMLGLTEMKKKHSKMMNEDWTEPEDGLIDSAAKSFPQLIKKYGLEAVKVAFDIIYENTYGYAIENRADEEEAEKYAEEEILEKVEDFKKDPTDLENLIIDTLADMEADSNMTETKKKHSKMMNEAETVNLHDMDETALDELYIKYITDNAIDSEKYLVSKGAAPEEAKKIVDEDAVIEGLKDLGVTMTHIATLEVGGTYIDNYKVYDLSDGNVAVEEDYLGMVSIVPMKAFEDFKKAL